MPELGDLVAGATSRRGFIARVGAALMAAAGARVATDVDDAEAFHFCGHIYTTGGCPHPTGLPRIDIRGYPLRARDGRPVDDLGRVVDRDGRALGPDDLPLRDPAGHLLPPAPRSRVCVDAVPERFRMRVHVDGSWYRCCGGRVRRLVDCCANTRTRINGDAALTGYCASGRKVFCVMYFDTNIPC